MQPEQALPTTPGAETQNTAPTAEPITPKPDTLSHDDALEALKKTRQEAASYRTKLKAFEDAQAAADAAKLSELERAQAAAKKMETALAETQQQLHSLRIERAAAKAGITDAAAAAVLLAASDIEYDPDDAKSIERALKDLAERHPMLKPPASEPKAPATPAPQAAMNPARSRVVATTQQPFDYANRPKLGAIWDKPTQ